MMYDKYLKNGFLNTIQRTRQKNAGKRRLHSITNGCVRKAIWVDAKI